MKHGLIKVLFIYSLFLISCQSQQILTQSQDADFFLKTSHYKNIKIHEDASFRLGPCEPSIAINPTNPKNMVAGSVLDNYHYSFDGGLTWTSKILTADLGVYGDPCIVADNTGVFYYLHLANPDGKPYASLRFLNSIVVHHSKDAGKSWNKGVGIGKNEPAQQDKEWAAVDPKTHQLYVTWTEFDKYGSKDPKHKSRIRFATSTDQGKTFSKAITISDLEGNAQDNDQTTEGAVPALGLDGTIYVAWAYDNKIFFDKSTDNGKTWLPNDLVITEQIGGWVQQIPDMGRSNGMPVTSVDNSNSKHQGSIYVNWTDTRNGKNNTDVFIIKSTDKGTTWSAPVQVNQDKTHTHQFFTWMSVDPITGFIYIVYYDRSRYTNSQTDVVLAISKDGGTTFSNHLISESPFTPSKSVFFGDYNNIAAFNGVVRPIWTRYENGKLSIWTALVDDFAKTK